MKENANDKEKTKDAIGQQCLEHKGGKKKRIICTMRRMRIRLTKTKAASANSNEYV